MQVAPRGLQEHRQGRSRTAHAPSCAARLVAWIGAGVVASIGAVALAEDPDAPPAPFGTFEGIPPGWTEVLNGYVNDPGTYGPRLAALERDAGLKLPPVFRVAAADANLRAGNRRDAERIFTATLEAGEGYPFDDFATLGLGTLRLAGGDEAGAEIFFGRLVESEQASSRALGNLGLGAAYAAGGRFAEAKAAFDDSAGADTQDPEVRRAGLFGSALALYASGDHAGAAQAFDVLAAEDPHGAMGQDARYAAARARLAMGQREESGAALRALIGTCDRKTAGGRAPRALRNLDPRALGRSWLRSYRKTGWGDLHGDDGWLYSIGGCSLARSTLRALERDDAGPEGIERVAAVALAHAGGATAPSAVAAGEPPSAGDARVEATAGVSWGALLLALAATATVAVAVLRRAAGRGTKAGRDRPGSAVK